MMWWMVRTGREPSKDLPFSSGLGCGKLLRQRRNILVVEREGRVEQACTKRPPGSGSGSGRAGQAGRQGGGTGGPTLAQLVSSTGLLTDSLQADANALRDRLSWQQGCAEPCLPVWASDGGTPVRSVWWTSPRAAVEHCSKPGWKRYAHKESLDTRIRGKVLGDLRH
jgi:hypothetical protein